METGARNTQKEAPPARRRVVLEPNPRSAGQARDVVSELLEDFNFGDLADTATLLVSELVTNAVLHAGTPIDLHCRVEAGTVCVEVTDRSPVLPGRRHYDDDALTGRGLELVDLLAHAWGVEGGEDGKTVWFQLGSDTDPEALRPMPDSSHGDWEGDVFNVTFLGLPAALVLTTVQYGDSVLRELALTSIADGSPEGPPSWQAAHVDLGPLLDAVGQGQRDGVEELDVTVPFPVGAGPAAFERLSLVEEADRMAREGVLLSAPALPEIGACRNWMLSQIGLQEQGNPPLPWQMPAPLPAVKEAALLPEDDRVALDQLATAAIVADDANRIIYANERAARLLGWSADELVGQRLVSIVPPELRQAHLAGFGRYLITAEPRLIGRPVRVPALRRDGTRVEIELNLSVVDVGHGRVVFRADIR